MIKLGGSAGTALTIDRAGRQYLVTAPHVLNGFEVGGTIGIWQDQRWVRYKNSQ